MTEDSPTQATPGSEVFVSYASQDTAVANAIVEVLEKHGIRCWIAPRDARAGAQYADAIVRAISGAKALVLVLSANAIASSHVGKEIERASSKKRPIIALRIDAAPLTPSLEYFLSESQWIEAPAGKMEAAYAKLIDAIREPDRTALTNFPAVAPEPSARTTPAGHPKSRRNRILLAAGLAVVAVTLAALWAANFRPAKRVTAEQPTTVATTAVSDKLVAVLPFVDMSEKKDQEYMPDGIAEELLNLLAQVPDLKVIARTLSFAFKGEKIEIAEIAKKLNVAHVVEGSVRKSGNKLRITAQLIRAADSTHLWSGKYDRPMDDIFAVQDEIANAIAHALQIRLMGGSLSSADGGTQVLEAYQLYLRANDGMRRNTKSSLQEAENYAERATKLDPNFGRAWSMLASVVGAQAENGYISPEDGYLRARELALHALKLSPKFARAHADLAYFYQFSDWNWTAAEAEIHRGLAIDPEDPVVLLSAGIFAATFGRWGEAERHLRAALVRDPLDPFPQLNLGTTYYPSGRFAEAESTLRALLERDPDFAWASRWLGKAVLAQGRPEEALAIVQQEVDDTNRYAMLPVMLHAVGRKSEAEDALRVLTARWGESWPFHVALTYAYRGEHGLALEWLERSHVQNDSSLAGIVGEPLLKGLADDPGYKSFLRKMKLPEG